MLRLTLAREGPLPLTHSSSRTSQVFQTLDGETRIYAMPFTAPPQPATADTANADPDPDADADAGADADADAAASPGVLMWQLSFRLPEAEALAMGRDGARTLGRRAGVSAVHSPQATAYSYPYRSPCPRPCPSYPYPYPHPLPLTQARASRLRHYGAAVAGTL